MVNLYLALFPIFRENFPISSQKTMVVCWLKIVCTACGIFNVAQFNIIHHTMLIIQLNSKYEVFYDLTILYIAKNT